MAVTVADVVDPMEEFVPRQIEPKPFRREDINPSRIVMSFDRRSDTFFIHLFGRDLETISVPVGKHLYALVTPAAETTVGFQIEGFLSQAVKDVPEFVTLLDHAELRGITPAEVRELQHKTLGVKRSLTSSRAELTTSVQERKRRAVAAFIESERHRSNLHFVPSVY
jgi:hypothetical protein